MLHLGSAGLRTDIDLDQGSTQPLSRRAPRSGSILLRAAAQDSESGITSVDLRGDLTIECVPTASNNIVRIRDPIALNQTGDRTSPPTTLSSSLRSHVLRANREVPGRYAILSTVGRFDASAKNGVGLERTLPEARVRVFGPDQLRVATFNVHGNQPDSQFTAWGTAIGGVADVILLTEIPDRRTGELLASAARMPYLRLFKTMFLLMWRSLRGHPCAT